MMTSFLTMIGVETAFHASEGASPPPIRPQVRVIWGRGLGSTYQGYFPAGPDESHFSRPLTCPGCAGSLRLERLDEHSHDHLLASCEGCGFESSMDIAGDGRITLG